MDAPRPEPPLRDLEAAPFAEQHVLGGHADVLEHHLAVAVRGVVIAEHRQHPLDRHAGRVERHEDHASAAVPRPAGSDLPITIATVQRGSPTPDDHHLRPLMT